MKVGRSFIAAVLAFVGGFTQAFGGAKDAYWDYARGLAERGEYKLAAEELNRTIHFFPDLRYDRETIETMLKWTEKSEDYPYAIRMVNQIENTADPLEIKCLARYYKGLFHYGSRSFKAATRQFEQGNDCPLDLAEKMRYQKSLSLMRVRDWESARSGLVESMQTKDVEEKRQLALLTLDMVSNQKFRSPSIAGSLSAVVPGAGYIYSKSPKSGVAAFLTTALFTWGAVSAFNKDQDGVGVVLGLFSVGWYMGNIRGSVHAAHRYNNYLVDKFVQPLELP